MSFLTLGGFPVLAIGGLVLPRQGAWRANDVEVATEDALSGAVSLVDGTIGYRGTVVSGTVDHTRWKGDLVGGANGLEKTATPRPYRDVTAGLVLADLLTEVGERLSTDTQPQVLAYLLAQWLRFGRAEDALDDLVRDELGATWRVLRDGSLWAGVDLYPSQEVEHVIIEESGALRKITIAPSRTDLSPGRMFLGRQVEQVTYTLSEEGLRAEVSFGG